jgi:hypothetical protein
VIGEEVVKTNVGAGGSEAEGQEENDAKNCRWSHACSPDDPALRVKIRR